MATTPAKAIKPAGWVKRYDHWHKVADPIVVDKMNGIQSIGFAPISGLLRNRARCKYLAMEATMFEAGLRSTGRRSILGS